MAHGFFTGVVGKEQIISIWPDIEPLIIRAISVYNDHSLDDIFQSLLMRERQLWISGNSDIDYIIITKIYHKQQDKRCLLELCAGRGAGALPYLNIIENWARDAGCDRIELVGRKGWLRVLKDYSQNIYILEKELN